MLAAGLGAGIVNGAAGGGTLVSFPALLATGLPALRSNMTSTVGIWPGYLGGMAGFRAEVRTQKELAPRLSVSALLGAVAGSVLLLTTSQHDFAVVTPYLVLAACALFVLQPAVARMVAGGSGGFGGPGRGEVGGEDKAAEGSYSRLRLWLAHAGTLFGSVYGGYFGAGLGVILLAVLGTVLPDDLKRTNGLRVVLSLVVNTGAALVFLVHGAIAWLDVALLVPTSLAGGYLGARVARRLPSLAFRVLVVGLGLATAIKLLVG